MKNIKEGKKFSTLNYSKVCLIWEYYIIKFHCLRSSKRRNLIISSLEVCCNINSLNILVTSFYILYYLIAYLYCLNCKIKNFHFSTI